MITFVIDLFIGGFFGIMFTSILVISRDESKYFSQKDILVSLRSLDCN
jgi:hypothetical protein